MNKLFAVLLVVFACLSFAHAQTDITGFVSSVLSDRASLVSSVLSEIDNQTTFSGSFSSYVSDLESLVSSIVQDITSTSTEIEVSTTTVKTSNAAVTATSSNGLIGMVSVLLAGLAFFYAF